MKTNLLDLAKQYKICEEIFDSISIYIHITSEPENPYFYQISFSDVPFSDKNWRSQLFHFSIGELFSDQDETGEEFADLTYNRCIVIINQLAFILTMKGHDVYFCSQANPNETRGEYELVSSSIKHIVELEKTKPFRLEEKSA